MGSIQLSRFCSILDDAIQGDALHYRSIRGKNRRRMLIDAYRNFGADELRRLVYQKYGGAAAVPIEDLMETTYRFGMKMKRMSMVDSRTWRTFKEASDVCENVLDILSAMQ